ncbi:hypothetical protein V4C53_42990 [Paraburkholderia azotifigens]|uniref:hypothetical protein n=1 Tax=Paraburkholderia azotifigens TaxID=2057004 RepID=UPI00317210D9
MTLLGNVQEGEWSVNVVTEPAEDGGFQSTIYVSHTSPDANFEHAFRHDRKFGSEREAALDGLRDGMTWIELKMARTIKV